MVADAAAKGIRERDETGRSRILGEEPTEPFPRPALCKKLWTDPDFTVEDTDFETAEATGAEICTGTRVTRGRPGAKRVTTAAGDHVGYGRLLLATGGHPKQIDGLEPGDRVIYFRTLTDYRALRALAGPRPHVAVVGGSYIGTEIAAALVQNGLHGHPGLPAGDPRCPHVPGAGRRGVPAGRSSTAGSPGPRYVGHRRSVPAEGVTLTLDGPGRDTLEADAVVIGLGIVPAGDFLAGGRRPRDRGRRRDRRRRAPARPRTPTSRRGRRRRLPRQHPRPPPRRARGQRQRDGRRRGPHHGRLRRDLRPHADVLLRPAFDDGYEASGPRTPAGDRVSTWRVDGGGRSSTTSTTTRWAAYSCGAPGPPSTRPGRSWPRTRCRTVRGPDHPGERLGPTQTPPDRRGHPPAARGGDSAT